MKHKNIERVMLKKYCPRCNTKKLRSEFYENKSQSTGLSSMCKKCTNLDNKKRYANLPIEIRQARRKVKYLKYHY